MVDGEEQVSGVRRREKRATVNYELRVAFLLLGAADYPLLTSDCLLHFEGSSSWRDSGPVAQPTTRCHRWQGKKNVVILKTERTRRECL